MITLSKSGNSVTFTFDENSGYLQNGTIDVPVNSLSLVIDDSDMATFRKSASNDIFISARYEEFGMSKAELEAWYKANMVSSGGGGGTGGTTPEEVQQMIDSSISGKTDTSAFTAFSGDVQSTLDEIETVAGAAFNDLNDRMTEKLDASAYTPVDLSDYYTTAQTDSKISEAVSGKQDTLTAGRGIDISANTISFDLPISAGTGTNSLIMSGSGNTASGDYSVAYGKLNSASGECSTANGNRNTANNFAEFSIGQKNVSRTEDSSAFGHSGNTLFSVGNGIINEEQGIDANHNAFEVRGNGEIYISDTNAAGSYYQKPMINLQDTLNGKQDTLSAGTNITISGNVISAEGGKAIEAGRGITVTTGATADTVSFNLPISGGSGEGSIIENYNGNVAFGNGSHAEGLETQANGQGAHAEGNYTLAGGNYSHTEGQYTDASGEGAHAEGYYTNAKGQASHAEGYYTRTNNQGEHASGRYNKSNTGSTDADKTLFSVGNGTSNKARHNAFEIRKNGDIYLTSGNTDIKLQDHLEGGVPESAFTAYTASTDSRIGEDEEVTAAALNVLDDKIDAVSGDVITISGAIPTTTSAVTSGSTAALTSGGAYTQFDGMKLKKLTQAQYDALAPYYDASTLYVIVN